MHKQKNERVTTWLKVLLAIGPAVLAQPSIASDLDMTVPVGALLEKVQAPSDLGGVSLKRPRPWGTAAAYRPDMFASGYGPAIKGGEARPLTSRRDIGIDPVQTAGIIPGVFGSVALSIRNLPVSARWAPVYRAIVDCSAGSACEHKSTAFAAIIDVVRSKDFSDKLSFVNSSINRLIAYKTDSALYGKLDYWATPSEILERRAGDCEDYAILKMTALLRAGVPAQSMSIVVVQHRRRGFFHAVLSVSTSSGTFILDNLSNLVLRDSDLPDYLPLFSVSADRAWIHGTRSGEPQVADIKGGFAMVAPGEGM